MLGIGIGIGICTVPVVASNGNNIPVGSPTPSS